MDQKGYRAFGVRGIVEALRSCRQRPLEEALEYLFGKSGWWGNLLLRFLGVAASFEGLLLTTTGSTSLGSLSTRRAVTLQRPATTRR
jgi:hypothetical protein